MESGETDCKIKTLNRSDGSEADDYYDGSVLQEDHVARSAACDDDA